MLTKAMEASAQEFVRESARRQDQQREEDNEEMERALQASLEDVGGMAM